MNRNLLILLFITSCIFKINAQADLLGNWELSKIVKLPKDTQAIKNDNEKYIKYFFNYNNTFIAYQGKDKEEVNGKWGFDRKENAIKVRNHTFVKSKNTIPDYNIKLVVLSKTFFIQVIEDKKGKPIEHHIYKKLES